MFAGGLPGVRPKCASFGTVSLCLGRGFSARSGIGSDTRKKERKRGLQAAPMHPGASVFPRGQRSYTEAAPSHQSLPGILSVFLAKPALEPFKEGPTPQVALYSSTSLSLAGNKRAGLPAFLLPQVPMTLADHSTPTPFQSLDRTSLSRLHGAGQETS